VVHGRFRPDQGKQAAQAGWKGHRWVEPRSIKRFLATNSADATVVDANLDAVLSVLRKKDKDDRMA
jgi:hypothetical protein